MIADLIQSWQIKKLFDCFSFSSGFFSQIDEQPLQGMESTKDKDREESHKPIYIMSQRKTFCMERAGGEKLIT